MRLLLLTHRVPFAPNRGDRIRAYYLLRFLAARYEVRLISLVHQAREREALRAPGVWPDGVAVAGAQVSRLATRVAALRALPTTRPLTHALLWSREMPALLATEAARRPDVVIAYGTGMMRYAMEPPLSGVPCVLDMVDLDSEKWAELAAHAPGVLGWVYRREARTLRAFERQAIRHARATTVVAERERELAARHLGGPPPAVVPNGVDLEAFAPPGPPGESRRVVFTGVFDYPPNEAAAVWLAGQVWPIVRAAEPGAVLQLVGMNPSRRVRALAGPGVEVTGEVPDVRPYLWNAAAAAAPLSVARGVQNKVLEALAAGLPCVVSPAVFGGLPAPVREGCVSRDGPAAFAEAIVALLRCAPAERRRFAARARLEPLAWDAQLAGLTPLLELAARSRPPVGAARETGTLPISL